MPPPPIDIDQLTEAELRDLNYRIVERLRVIHQLRAHGQMMRFSVGDRVAFEANGRELRGVLTRYNRKTVTVLTDDGGHWNVSPGLLAPIDAPDPPVAEVRPDVRPDVRPGHYPRLQQGS
jgi:hypothetical protein